MNLKDNVMNIKLNFLYKLKNYDKIWKNIHYL